MARRGRRGRKGGAQGGVSLISTPLEAATSSDSSGRSTPDSSDAASVASGASDMHSSKNSNSVSNYDLSFIEEVDQLVIDKGWSKKEKSQHRLELFDAAWDEAFGTDMTKVEKWQELCRMCKIEPVPESINKCKKALAKIHVNIYNFLDNRRNPQRFKLIIFPNVKKLRDYTLWDLIYPLDRAKKDTFLKALLRPLFFGRKKVT